MTSAKGVVTEQWGAAVKLQPAAVPAHSCSPPSWWFPSPCFGAKAEGGIFPAHPQGCSGTWGDTLG